uniref:protein-glutamate methylesterase/protein-glutamine glutaminase n=1 Tax=Comamonas terrigena TaxID=32013 RepID=UPI0009F9DA41|nr:chemotaxis response regulator protein-glutamate methylesterase [Comamonas terrigena]
MSKKIRVIVVDDSALVRSLLAEIINRQSDMECIGTANDPLIAREMIRELNPDVITLDVEMPRMDGIDFLGRLMRLRPMPVLMISTLTERGAEVTMRALELGAVDFVAKPRVGVANGLQDLANQIVDKIRVAAVAQVHRAVPAARPAMAPAAKGAAPGVAPAPVSSASLLGRLSTEKVIAIGASTGGTEAIKEVLVQLPADSPAIVITQHMPPGFTTSFAARLNGLCQITVKEAVQGERILPGHAYIAPGGKQFSIARSGANYVAVVNDEPPVNRHKPSVEVLFKSVAACVGRNAFGVMLTGMGADGAAAMREMKDAGSYNYVQDEASCIVFGMPREAIAHGAADEVLPLTQIASAPVPPSVPLRSLHPAAAVAPHGRCRWHTGCHRPGWLGWWLAPFPVPQSAPAAVPARAVPCS